MVNTAILGFGTVGSGVAEVLSANAARVAAAAGDEVRVKYIVDLRDFPESPFADLVVHDFAVVENDPSVSIVIESIGGVGAALDFTRRSLCAGKSVVTSNKELVAKHGQELLELAEKNNVSYLFEASVGGGIPVIHAITKSLASNSISEIYGILNGTTNFILSGMFERGGSFDDMLAEAQRLGFAELDPAADVEGYDAARKICILADLAFGRRVDPDAITRVGISGVTAEDALCAARLGCRIKLLGRAYLLPDGAAAVYVAPHLIPAGDILASVGGVTNAVVLQGNAVGECTLCGPGAGSLPTASAVVSDVIDVAAGSPYAAHWESADEGYLADTRELDMRWYLRCGSGAEELRAALGEDNISAFVYLESGGAALITKKITGRELDTLLCGKLEVPSRFMVLD